MEAHITDLQRTVEALAQRLEKLEKQVSKLEEEPKRHTHSTNACFEDSIAVITDVLMEEEQQREYTRARLSQLLKILQEGRQSPQSYDPNRQAGKRLQRE